LTISTADVEELARAYLAHNRRRDLDGKQHRIAHNGLNGGDFGFEFRGAHLIRYHQARRLHDYPPIAHLQDGERRNS